MASTKEPDCLKFISPVLKTAKEFAKRDPVITYYCNVYAIQKSLAHLGKKRPKEADLFLLGMMDQVETMKKQLVGEEAVTSDIVAQAHVENKALQLFTYADNEDRAGRFGKNVVKAFYTAHILFEVVSQFGELSGEVEERQRYAKWKAAYISRCLKDGQTPVAGPVGGEEEMGGEMGASGAGGVPAVGGDGGGAGGPAVGFGTMGGAGGPAVGFGAMGGAGGPAMGFGAMGGNQGPSDPDAIPGFVQPMNPMASFSQPTNPSASFHQPAAPAYGQLPPGSYQQPPPSSAPFGQPPANVNQPSPSLDRPPAASGHSQVQLPPTSTMGAPSFDPSAAAAANAAAMASMQSPHAAPRGTSPTPTPPAQSPSGSLRPTPTPRQVDCASKIFPIPSSGNFQTLDYDKKARLEKVMKFASSALMYDDMVTVAQNLTRAHNIVFHGREE